MPPARFRALIFDVDGTLYRQGPVRRGMLKRLAAACLRHPPSGIRSLRALRAYRQAQEILRQQPVTPGDLGQRQLDLACERAGLPVGEVRDAVARWMEREPLDLVAAAKQEGLDDLLQAAREHGVRVAVLSDYPAIAKLEAMGIAEHFEVVACAQDPEIQRFKPDPRGLEVVRRRLGVTAAEAVYVGDRHDVDGTAAKRAGMGFILVGSTLEPLVVALGGMAGMRC
ncbi:MAG: HAD family hydrolase [Acidobacteria bacterium]|nr:HAD family hydrolase [Acidobacteriota bacterium]